MVIIVQIYNKGIKNIYIDLAFIYKQHKYINKFYLIYYSQKWSFVKGRVIFV